MHIQSKHIIVTILMMGKAKYTYYVMTLLRIIFLWAMRKKKFIATVVILLLMISFVTKVIQV